METDKSIEVGKMPDAETLNALDEQKKLSALIKENRLARRAAEVERDYLRAVVDDAAKSGGNT